VSARADGRPDDPPQPAGPIVDKTDSNGVQQSALSPNLIHIPINGGHNQGASE
jgi:hypothetical protein